jgi:hypothetical protein
LVVSSSHLLLIDDFETGRTWEPVSSQGCSIKIILDHGHTKQGETSLRMDMEFTEECTHQCYAGITRDAPDLTGYEFLRFWVKVNTDIPCGIHVACSDNKESFYTVPVDTREWQLITVSFSQFESDNSNSIDPGTIETISLFFIANTPVKARAYFDELVALTDSNKNGIPDIDEASMVETAQNADEMGDTYFDEGQYEKAIKYYEEAKSVYQKIGDDAKAQEMDTKIEKSRGWLKFEEAESLYEQNKYTMAENVYEEARKHFVSAGDLDMVDSIESRLEELHAANLETEEPETPPETFVEPDDENGASGLLLVVFVVFLVGIGVYVWKFKGKKLEQPPKTGAEKIKLKEKPKRIEPEVIEPEGKPEGKLEPPAEKKEQSTCPMCGNTIDKEWVSCPYCGIKLKDDTLDY